MLLNKPNAGTRWKIRPDGADKVTGKCIYLTDMHRPGMLYGKILRSRHAHARVLFIRTEEAERLPGVHAVITYRDVPGMNRFGIAIPDQPVLCEDRVRYIGDALAAVAADSLEIAEQALRMIEVVMNLYRCWIILKPHCVRMLRSFIRQATFCTEPHIGAVKYRTHSPAVRMWWNILITRRDKCIRTWKRKADYSFLRRTED